MWLIWSNEHSAYWGPEERFYVATREEAGRYSLKDALRIVRDGNKDMKEERVPNESMIADGLMTEDVSDGFHTFDELYKHRIILFIVLCRTLANQVEDFGKPWKSRKHSDGSSFDGWFIMGIYTEKGDQISYHIPDRYWGITLFATELERAPEWDGHTSEDVLHRLLTKI